MPSPYDAEMMGKGTEQATSAQTQGRNGRKGSLIADQYNRGERIAKDGVEITDAQPTNEEIAKAVQQKVAVGCHAMAAAVLLVLRTYFRHGWAQLCGGGWQRKPGGNGVQAWRAACVAALHQHQQLASQA